MTEIGLPLIAKWPQLFAQFNLSGPGNCLCMKAIFGKKLEMEKNVTPNYLANEISDEAHIRHVISGDEWQSKFLSITYSIMSIAHTDIINNSKHITR